MDEFLDIVWNRIMMAVGALGSGFYSLVAPLNVLGPAAVIAILAVVVVMFTRFLSRRFVTRRYRRLKAEYQHWYQVREEALKAGGREKGKALAKNIDQAQLNRTYYDYFFEGLMINLATKYLPVFLMAAFVNEYYRPERLTQLFGRPAVFIFQRTADQPVAIGSVLWYVICLLAVYLLWPLIRRAVKTGKAQSAASVDPSD